MATSAHEMSVNLGGGLKLGTYLIPFYSLGQCWCGAMPGEAPASNAALRSLFTFTSPPTNIPTTAPVSSAHLLFLEKCEATPRREKEIDVHLKEDDGIITFHIDVFDSLKAFWRKYIFYVSTVLFRCFSLWWRLSELPEHQINVSSQYR